MMNSLKIKLLLTGLICALLAGFAGGAGIWSLNQIHATFKETTTSVGDKITTQNSELILVIERRKIVSNILNANTIKELETYLPQIIRIGNNENSSSDHSNDGFKKLIQDLFQVKRDSFVIENILVDLESANKKILDEITSLSFNLTDDIEFDAIVSMENASGLAIRDINSQLDSTKTLQESKLKILDSYQHMKVITDKAFLSLKTALIINMRCKEIDALLKDVFLLNDADLIEYQHALMDKSLENIKQNLNELPASAKVTKLETNLSGLESNIHQIYLTALRRLNHRNDIFNADEKIKKQLSYTQETTLVRTADMVQKAEKELKGSDELVKKWKKIELIIVAITLVLVIIISFGLSHSVSRQLSQLNEGIDIIAKGNLDHRVDTKTKDEIGYFSRSFDDMTRTLKKNMNEMTQARMDAEQASIAKTEFLANMTHEIRTPMNGVLGMLETLSETPLTTEQKNFMDIAKTSADAMLALINDILDFSKVEAGKLDIENIDFNLRTTLENSTDMLAVKAFEKGIEFACIIKEDVPVDLNGDPGRIRQIISNLCGNAIKFVEKGEVSIQVSVQSQSEQSVLLLFKVTDTGIGIPESKIPILFDSFTQVDASTTRKYGGTGLGLAISKQLVELMGGRIGVESEQGKGSTFWFTIDFHRQRISPDKQILPCEDLKGVKILIVDEKVLNHKVLSEHLKSWECRFEAATTGNEAVRLLKEACLDKDPFQIVLMDMHLPSMTGEEAGRLIKNDPGLKETHLVVVSSAAKRGDAARFKQYGFSGFLTKPVKKQQIFDCLRALLGTSSEYLNDPKSPIITQYTLEDHTPIVEDATTGLDILLVEDNIINQKVVTTFLKKTDHVITIANNGEEAVKITAEKKFDFILMDNQMPVMGGIEAAAIIRKAENEKGIHTPIIALTANAMVGDREKFLAAGMDDYLSKPLKKQRLFQLISEFQNLKKTG